MRRGRLRTELQALEADLARGTPLGEALKPRQLPELYKQMLQVGAQGNDLPGLLILVADYYTHTHALTTRVKGLMVYPVLVLILAIALSTSLAAVFFPMLTTIFNDMFGVDDTPRGMLWGIWVAPILLLLVFSGLLLFWLIPGIRKRLFWCLPGFRDIGLARVGATMNLLLRGGASLPQALALVGRMEQASPAAQDCRVWETRLREGGGRLADLAGNFRAFPPLFVWIIASAGDDLAKGFFRAGEIYARRAQHQSEMILFAALPVVILVVGGFTVLQFAPLFRFLVMLMEMVGSPM
jgi:type II secretory pathway component PulF